MSLIPVYVYEPGDELPENGNYYVIAKNSAFLHKDAGIVKGLVKIRMEDLPLGELTPNVRLNLPKLPAELLFRCLLFFRRVYYQKKSEAALILFFHRERKEYFLHCPQQHVSSGGVDYGVDAHGDPSPVESQFQSEMQNAGYRKVGTIHSHCDFGAFHSNVDTTDEQSFDGIHITLGNVNSKDFSVVSSLVVNDNRFQVNPESVCLGLSSKARSVSGAWFGHNEIVKFYDFDFTEEQQEAIVAACSEHIEKEWMPLVFRGRSWKKKHWWSEPIQPEVAPVQVEEPPLAEVVEPDPVQVEEPQPLQWTEAKKEFIEKVATAAHTLFQHNYNIPAGKAQEYYNLLRKFFNKETGEAVSHEEIKFAITLNFAKLQEYESMGYTVHE